MVQHHPITREVVETSCGRNAMDNRRLQKEKGLPGGDGRFGVTDNSLRNKKL
jgi:hypothetical protein